MNVDEIKQILNTFNQEDEKLPEVLYWLSQGLNDAEVGKKTLYSAGTVHIRRHVILGILRSHGIEGINAHVRQAIEELAGRPPKFDPWPPIEQVTEPGPDPEQEEEIEQEEEQISEPERQIPLPIPNLGPDPLLTRLRNSIPFEITRRNIAVTLMVAAIVFGAILVFTWRPWENDEETPAEEPTTTVQATQEVSEVDITQTLAARETRVSEIFTSVAPTPITPNPTQTQAAIETEDAHFAFQTVTAAVTPTPTPTATSTNTPSPIPPPPTNNLVVHLSLDGHTEDMSGNGLNATNIGAFLTEGRHDEPNTAYRFGNTSVIIVPDSPRLKGNTSAITVAVWFKTASLSTLDRKFSIITKFLNASSKDWGLLVGGNDLLSFSSENGRQNRADYTCWQQEGKVSGNEWHLGVFVADPPNLYLYLDGVLVGHCTDFEQRWIATDNNVEIGNVIYNDNLSFEGSIDDVWIWDRALLTEEILNLYLFTK